ncbi:MAG: ribosomal-processing cysteine protease Prp [Christensenellales bacterium]|nr:ribosomal-processing cysteine protease Prp [Christensenellales bacterium]
MKSFGTTVTFWRRSDGALIGYQAEGHSGYAEAGEDIVCAAISALTQTTLNGLANVLKAPVMHDQDDQSGYIEARLMPEATEEQIQGAQLLLGTLLQGLQAIEGEYPRNIRIIIRERRKSTCSR